MRKPKKESCSRLTASLLQQEKRGLEAGLSLESFGFGCFGWAGSWNAKSGASATPGGEDEVDESLFSDRGVEKWKIEYWTERVKKCAAHRTLTDDGILVDGGGGRAGATRIPQPVRDRAKTNLPIGTGVDQVIRVDHQPRITCIQAKLPSV